MAKTSGNNRGTKSAGGGISFFRETEKAVQLELAYDITVAPSRGFTSSLAQDLIGREKVWVPKSQIQDGKLSDWIYNSKVKEVGELIASRRGGVFVGANYTNSVILDAKGNTLRSFSTAKPKAAKPTAPKAPKVKTNRAFPTRESIVAGLKRRGKSSKEAWKIVNSKYKTISGANVGKIVGLKDIIDQF